MEDILQKLLSANIENEVLELKEAKRQFDTGKLGKYFSALSNEANLRGTEWAWIAFGVNNDGRVTGTDINEKQLNGYKEEVSKNTAPKMGFDSFRVAHEGFDVILLRIPAAPQGMPVSWKGHYYGRDGESLGALNIGEIERIRQQSNHLDWSAQLTPGASLHDLSAEAILEARKQFGEKNPKLRSEIDKWDDITFLNKSRLLIKGQVTNTAILLLGKPESEHYISPASGKITWVLRDRDGIEKDYEHFGSPLLLAVEQIYAKIRNLKYRYLKDGSLFPDEVDQYDPFTIREAINNCIAHQDYLLGGKINVIEREDGVLTFINSGSFIPKSIEHVIRADAPETIYRNQFLANAMVNLNMIDTIGSGIKRMFIIQKNKLFPLPDYDLSNNKVRVQIVGKVIDVNYARKLAQMQDLSLSEIILLDKVAKQKPLSDLEIKDLKAKQLIEGRKPNFHISSNLAKAIGEKDKYIRQKGIDDEYCQKIILDYLNSFKEGKRADFEKVLLDKLPDVLSHEQKVNKIRNNLQALRKEGKIYTEGKVWKTAKSRE